VTGRTKEGNGGAEVGARRTTTWDLHGGGGFGF
jgi:hypothetical protein